MRNITRFCGITRPFHKRSAWGSYFVSERSGSARRSGESARNSARPRIDTPRTSSRVPLSATMNTRGARRRFRIFCVSSMLIIVIAEASCRNHIGVRSGAPSAPIVASTTTSLVVRKPWTVVSASVIGNLRFSRHHGENKSGRQGMLKLFVELFNARIQSEAQHVAPIDPSQPPGAGNDQEAEGPDALQQVRVRSFARPRFRLRTGVELKVSEEVMGE